MPAHFPVYHMLMLAALTVLSQRSGIVHDDGSLVLVPAPQDTSRPVLPDQPNLPGDSTFTVEAPPYARSALLYYRNIVGVTFHGSTGGETIRAILRKYGGVIIGGVPGPAGDPEYIIQVPDPGLTLAAVDSLVSEIAREPGVKRTAKVHFRTPLRLKSRHANDRPGS